MARKRARTRNTAPLWKKAAILVCAVTAAAVTMVLLKASGLGFWPLFAGVVVVAIAALWLVSRLLGVHLGLHSWD